MLSTTGQVRAAAPETALDYWQARFAMDARDGRAEAKRLLAEIAAGRDPAMARQEDREALTFGEPIDLYLTEGASHKKASTLKADRGRIEHHLRPLLGKLRADRIVRADSSGCATPLRRQDHHENRRRSEASAGQHCDRWQRRRSSMRCARKHDLGFGIGRGLYVTTQREASRKRPCGKSSASCRKRRSPGWPKLSTRRRKIRQPLPIGGDQAPIFDRLS